MATKKEEKEKLLCVTLVKSAAGCFIKQKRTVEALGLKKLHQSVTVKDNDAMRGMIHVVNHLVSVSEVEA